MVLYIDETENSEYFIVAGLLVDSEQSVQEAYKKFKNRIKGFKINPSTKSKLFVEFKSTLIDRKYQRIKNRMLEEIADLNCTIFYRVYRKQGKLNQVLKESIYITMLSSILTSAEGEKAVVFDRFGKPDFEDRIIRSVEPDESVIKITPGESQKESGLQFVDNICSTIRLHLSEEDEYGYYKIIENRVAVIDGA